jgi:hypothetical protein
LDLFHRFLTLLNRGSVASQSGTVILSAFIPSLIAQKLFQPRLKTMHAWGRLYQRKVNPQTGEL